MKRTILSIAAALAVLTMSSFAHAFSALRPTAAQQAHLKAHIINNAKRTNLYKSLKRRAVQVDVTFSEPRSPRGFIGNGFLQATAVIKAASSAPMGEFGPVSTREYTIREDFSKRAPTFKAVPSGGWSKIHWGK